MNKKHDQNVELCGYISPQILTVKLESCHICESSNQNDSLRRETDPNTWGTL